MTRIFQTQKVDKGVEGRQVGNVCEETGVILVTKKDKVIADK